MEIRLALGVLQIVVGVLGLIAFGVIVGMYGFPPPIVVSLTFAAAAVVTMPLPLLGMWIESRRSRT